jgi:hypothetical protein
LNFFKRLFCKDEKASLPPLIQKRLSLGRITAKVSLKNGKVLFFKFAGQYNGSEWYPNLEYWGDEFCTAKERFNNWLARLSETLFLEREENVFIPISDIVEISIEKQDHFVETDRKY